MSGIVSSITMKNFEFKYCINFSFLIFGVYVVKNYYPLNPHPKNFCFTKNSLNFAPAYQGRVAERLGRGLQNLVQRFESAPDLL